MHGVLAEVMKLRKDKKEVSEVWNELHADVVRKLCERYENNFLMRSKCSITGYQRTDLKQKKIHLMFF